MPLSNKQQAFVNEYVKCWDATSAVLAAGYRAGNRQRASEIGYQLLQNTPVSEEIERRKAELIMSADEVMARLTEQARAAQSVYLKPNGTVDFDQLIADGKAHLVKKTKPTKYGLEIEFHDAQSALHLIGKDHGRFADKHTLTVKLEKELDAILDIAKQVLSPDAYNALLAGIGGETDSPTSAE